MQVYAKRKKKKKTRGRAEKEKVDAENKGVAKSQTAGEDKPTEQKNAVSGKRRLGQGKSFKQDGKMGGSPDYMRKPKKKGAAISDYGETRGRIFNHERKPKEGQETGVGSSNAIGEDNYQAMFLLSRRSTTTREEI